jgi:hypothetical protein
MLAPVENDSIFAGFDDGTEQGSGHPRTLPRLPTGAGFDDRGARAADSGHSRSSQFK